MIEVDKIIYEKKFDSWTTIENHEQKVKELSDSHLANILCDGYINKALLVEAYKRGWNPPLNIGECSVCKHLMLSISQHDFQRCPCKESFIDGGTAYRRPGGKLNYLGEIWDKKGFKETLIKKSDKYEEITECKFV